MPTAHKDDAAKIFVEAEGEPDAEQTETAGNAEKPGYSHRHRPLTDNSYTHGIDGIACGSKGAAGKDIFHTAIAQEKVDEEYPSASGDDILIVGEESEKQVSACSKYGCHNEREDGCHAVDIVAKNIGGTIAQLAYIVTDKDVASLHNARTEEDDEGDGGSAIYLSGEGFGGYLVYGIGDDYLRQ